MSSLPSQSHEPVGIGLQQTNKLCQFFFSVVFENIFYAWQIAGWIKSTKSRQILQNGRKGLPSLLCDITTDNFVPLA